MSPRARHALRLAASLGAGALIAWALYRRLGLDPGVVRVNLSRVPLLAPRLPAELREPIELLAPRALWGLVALPWFALIAGFSLADLPRAQRALGVLARAGFFTLLLLALARPTATSQSRKVCTVFVVDVSDSVADDALARFHDVVQSATRARGENLVRLVTFARRPRVVPLPEDPAAPLPPLARHDAARGATGAGAGSDLAAALSLSYGLFPTGYLRRAVVLSDGVQTEGDALAEADRAARFGLRVSVVPARERPPAEVAVRALRVPDRITVGSPFEVRATVFSSRPSRASVTLFQGETVNGLDGARTVDLQPGENELRFRSVMQVPGDVTYSLRLTPEGPDRFAENNRYVTAATAPGRPTVLYVEGDATRGEWFRNALSGGEFEVESRGARGFPQSLEEMRRFDFIVLSDVGAEHVSAGSQQALGRYLRELGGGFMMAGGSRGFGLGGWQGTEVERLLPVRLDAERRRDQPSVALALVIDRSGSMQGAPLALAQAAALATARALGPDDALEVIVFDTRPERVVRMQSARNRVRIENELRRLRPGGGTAIFPALDAAAQDLALTRAVTKHVIVLTDGQGQPDEPPRLRILVDAMAADGVTVSTVGLGPQVDRELLEGLARRGRGRSYVTADANSLPQIFLRETNLVSRSAAVEDPVLPRVVTPTSFTRELGANAPYLYGFVSTRARPSPAQLLLETDTGEPLMARWRVGLGWSLAWTSDLKNRWAVEWIRWPRWRAFWTQVVREHMRQRRREEMSLRAEVVAGSLRASVDVITEDDRFENGLESELVIRGPLPSAREDRVPMRQVGPGRYEADVPMDRFGAFTLRAEHRRDGRVLARSRGRADNPYPREYAALEPDLATLTSLARATGGGVDPTPAAMFDPGSERIRHPHPVWKYPVLLAVGALLLDLTLRRVRLLDRAPTRRRARRADARSTR
ncbi:MAG: VWA domain-containing protein [Polyangiales bacterium]